jgi:hypothetical protein
LAGPARGNIAFHLSSPLFPEDPESGSAWPDLGKTLKKLLLFVIARSDSDEATSKSFGIPKGGVAVTEMNLLQDPVGEEWI